MRFTSIFTVAIGACFALSSGCAAFKSGREVSLKPSMVSPQFRDLDEENPFVRGKTKVDAMKVGIASYDQFFVESAKIKGTVIIADLVLKETDAFIANSKKRIAAGAALSPAQKRATQMQVARLSALTKLLGSLRARADKLVDTGSNLGKTAPKTFIGPNAMKLPGVVKGLGEAAKDLTDSAKRAPALLEHGLKTAGSLASLD
jgi:hypothetical protein